MHEEHTGIAGQQRQHLFFVFAVLLLFALFAVLVLTKPIGQDEGVFLTIGKYLDQGLVPYRDFFDHKPPAIYFLFALLFKIFGTNVFVVKAALILSTLGSTVLVMKIGEMVKKGTGWYAAALLLFLMTQFEGYFLIAEPFLLLPLLVSLFLLLRSGTTPRWMFVAGLSLTTALLFKQTAVMSALPLLTLLFRRTRQEVTFFFFGLLLPFFLCMAYLFSIGSIGDAWEQIVTRTLISYPREPLGQVLVSLKTNFLWTLPVWVLLLVGLGVHYPRKKMLWALVVLPFPFLFFRHYPHYWVQILPFVAVLAAVALSEIRKRTLTVALCVFCFAIAGGKVMHEATANLRILHEQLRVAEILRQEPASVVLAENQFTAFYFLLPQKPLNEFLYITEITDAKNAERRTIDDLRQNNATLILWPTDSNFAYAKKLQNFLLENAKEEQVFETLGIRVLKYRPF